MLVDARKAHMNLKCDPDGYFQLPEEAGGASAVAPCCPALTGCHWTRATWRRWGGIFDWNHAQLRVRVEIMGSQKCRIVGKSQSVLILIDPIISTRTRT